MSPASAPSQVLQPGLIHTVYFWLKPGLSPQDEQQFLAGLRSLAAIEPLDRIFIGPPAPTEERGVVDRSYSYALINWFADVAAHDAYQIDPIHLKFVEENKKFWTKVVVYDNLLLE